MRLKFNITFDDGDQWRVDKGSVDTIQAWRPDPNDRDTGLPILIAVNLVELFDQIEHLKSQEDYRNGKA